MGRSSQPNYIISFTTSWKCNSIWKLISVPLQFLWGGSAAEPGKASDENWHSCRLLFISKIWEIQLHFFLFLCFMVSFYSSPFFPQPAPAVHTPATQCTTKAIGSHFQCLASQTKAVFSSSCETSCSLPDCSPQGEQDVGQTYCTKTKRTVHY